MYTHLMFKGLLLFWGIVFSVTIMKFATEITIPNMSLNFGTVVAEDKIVDEREIRIPLEEYFGLVIEGAEGCMKDHKFHTSKESLNTSSSCWNGECKVTVEFGNSIPKEVGLYIKENGKCVEKKFQVANNIQTIGYRVDLQLTQEQKSFLGIVSGDKVELKNANGYSLNILHQHYYYDTKANKDMIVVNDEERGTVYFTTNNRTKVQGVTPSTKDTIKKYIFTYTCNTKTSCTRTANTYILQIDGLFVELEIDFVEECTKDRSEGKKVNKYCKDIIFPGSTKSFTASANVVIQLYNGTKNL